MSSLFVRVVSRGQDLAGVIDRVDLLRTSVDTAFPVTATVVGGAALFPKESTPLARYAPGGPPLDGNSPPEGGPPPPGGNWPPLGGVNPLGGLPWPDPKGKNPR